MKNIRGGLQPSGHKVLSLAVYRFLDGCVVGLVLNRLQSQLQNEATKQMRDAFANAKRTGSARQAFKGDAGREVYLLVDSTATYAYAAGIDNSDTANPMSERLIYRLIGCFQTEVLRTVGTTGMGKAKANSLTSPLQKDARELMKAYDESKGADETQQAINKVEHVKIQMNKTIKAVLETHENLAELENKTQGLASSAKQFNKNAGTVQYDTWRRKVWMTFLLSLVAAGFVAITVFMIVDVVS